MTRQRERAAQADSEAHVCQFRSLGELRRNQLGRTVSAEIMLAAYAAFLCRGRGGFTPRRDIRGSVAEKVAALNACRERRGPNGRPAVGRNESECAVAAVLVVVRHVDAKDAIEMAATDDQETIEAVFAEGAHPPFRIRVRVRRPNRRPDTLRVVARVEPRSSAAEGADGGARSEQDERERGDPERKQAVREAEARQS